MWTGIVALTLIAAACGLVLGLAGRFLRPPADPVVDRIDALLPQTQCGQCGYPGCRPYAEAIAAGEADINRCPPGGETAVRALAELLGREAVRLDPGCGETKPPQAAVVDEDWCVGCTLCLEACPVDAIVGAAGRMHTVLADRCTGCELCISPCRMDCIRMTAVHRDPERWRWLQPRRAA